MRNSTFLAICVLGTALALMVASPARAQQPADGVQASQDAYQAAEAERRAAIDRQHQLVDQMRLQAAWPNTSYAHTLGNVYGYTYVYGPRRGYRAAVWLGPPAIAVSPRGPNDFLAPYGYAYRPWYGPLPQSPSVTSPYRQGTPTPATRPPAVLNDSAPVPPAPAPEPIPAPPSVPGPREF
jgi:hypothetical protein